jgi:hypothetical protein
MYSFHQYNKREKSPFILQDEEFDVTLCKDSEKPNTKQNDSFTFLL